ncbi:MULTISPECIES: hypothetical protein [unclassified Nocardia]|uniref:hypothetical protein n=1 Tax=unclassified Nocardia TaxID=2637762 RepID=UPI001CE3ECFC|nr:MULTISPECIES: hypothetical protein [unclassified Nocardia]
MSTRPMAIGYLRRDISGVSQTWDETRIRSLARRLGYELSKTVVFGRETEQPEQKLLEVVAKNGAEAVIIPDTTHFDGTIPEALVRACDVITVSPEYTYARWAIPPRTDGSAAE